MSQTCETIVTWRPPRISMALLMAALSAQWLLPFGTLQLASSQVAGAALLASGFAIMIYAWQLFREERTAICPTAEASALIVRGVYRFTRNPMYLGMIIMMAGAAAWFGTWPFYLATVLYFLLIDHCFCPLEERNLERLFGDEYRKYRAKVRRWI